MEAPGVEKPDPATDDPGVMLLGFEAMTLHALLLQGSDQTFDQSVVRPQQERCRDPFQAPVAGDQGLLERW